jgi:hypothetical protein
MNDNSVTLAAVNPSREVTRRAPGNGRPFAALALPLVLVNGAAVWGQAGWAYVHVTGTLTTVDYLRWALAFVFALAVESVGIYLAWEAHGARMADQAAGVLMLGAYAVGALAGTLNFLHFRASLDVAVTFAVMSAISPWLWGVWSKARNRGRLAALGLVDPRGVKLSTSRKFWHPIRSLKVMSWAAWEAETDPVMAVRGWELTRTLPEAPVSPSAGKLSRDQVWPAALQIWSTEPTLSQKAVAERLGISDRWLRACKPTDYPTGQYPVIGDVQS